MCSRILVLACLLALAGAQLVLEDEPGASLMDGNDGEMTAGAAGGAQRQEAKDPMTRMLQWGMENSDLDEFAKKAQLIRERAHSASVTRCCVRMCMLHVRKGVADMGRAVHHHVHLHLPNPISLLPREDATFLLCLSGLVCATNSTPQPGPFDLAKIPDVSIAFDGLQMFPFRLHSARIGGRFPMLPFC